MTSPAILVVDDQIGVRKLLEATLTADGYQVITAGNGQEALDCLQGETNFPSLALVDLRMPVMDGTHTLAALKERWPKLPVVMMTAVGEVDRETELFQLGAACTIGKPFDLQQIRTLVTQLLAGEENRR